jgi:hypothetical protein
MTSYMKKELFHVKHRNRPIEKQCRDGGNGCGKNALLAILTMGYGDSIGIS